MESSTRLRDFIQSQINFTDFTAKRSIGHNDTFAIHEEQHTAWPHGSNIVSTLFSKQILQTSAWSTDKLSSFDWGDFIRWNSNIDFLFSLFVVTSYGVFPSSLQMVRLAPLFKRYVTISFVAYWQALWRGVFLYTISYDKKTGKTRYKISELDWHPIIKY